MTCCSAGGRWQVGDLPHLDAPRGCGRANLTEEVFSMNWRSARWLMCGCLLAAAGGRAQPQAAEPIGLFAGHTDVGAVLHAGSVVYDAAKRSYIISGSGENVWATADAFQFVWKKM